MRIIEQPDTFYTVNEKPILIGRKKDCDIVLPDKTVSRRHAEVYVKDGMFHLHNLSQTNAIIVYPVYDLDTDEERPLKPGDYFYLGPKRLRLLSSDERHIHKLSTPVGKYLFNGQQPLIIGRKHDCDIVLNNTLISRHHARLFEKDGKLWIRNLSQTMPIRVYTGHKLPQGKATHLKFGDFFKVGYTRIRTQPQETQGKSDALTLSKHDSVRCSGCHHIISASLKDCAWCGLSLAGAITL